METSNDGLTTCPTNANIIPFYKQNQKNVFFTVYLGQETVHFKYQDMRGQFHHDGQSITHITCNFTTMKDLRNCLAEIGVYCRWGFDKTTSRTYQAMKREIRRYICENIHHFLNVRVSELHECVARYPTPTQIGKLKLNPACEYQALGKCLCPPSRGRPKPVKPTYQTNDNYTTFQHKKSSLT